MQTETNTRSFLASGAIDAFIEVDVQADGTITPCAGSASVGVGVTQTPIADGNYGSVRLWTASGTFAIQITGSAITPGTTYAIVTGGYAGAVNGTFGPANLKALESSVASAGAIVEFASLI